MSDSENDFQTRSVALADTFKGQRFAAVCNNWTEEKYELIKTFITEHCLQGIVAKEVAPTTGTRHLQVAFNTKIRKEYRSLHLALPGFDIRKQVKPYLANYRYCKKTDKDAWTFGQIPTNIVKKGSRTDIETAMQTILAAESWSEVILNPDIADTTARHLAWARSVYQHKRHESVALPKALYAWQALLVQELKQPPHPRKIIWYNDIAGNHGKSTLANVLCNKYKAIELPNKAADAAYMYDRQPIIIWDFSRTVLERVQYGLIEQFKNGRITNTKYESHAKQFSTPHIVVFANFAPDNKAWSADRYDIREVFDMELDVFDEPEVYQIPDDVTDYIPSPPPSPEVIPESPLPVLTRPAPFRRQGAFCSPFTSPITADDLPPRKRHVRINKKIVFESEEESE